MASDPINVAIAGYGLAGKVFHATLVAHTEGLRLHGVFSRSAERRAQAGADWGVRTYATYEELLQDRQVDLVIVATPHDTHAPMVIEAARAGKHVVTDKIMCLTLEEGRAMIEAARRAGVVFSVFHNRRWDSDYLTLRRVLEQGTLGEIFVIEEAVTSFRLSPRGRGWRGMAAAGGGPTRDWGAHLFDHCIQLAGFFGTRPESVFADFQYRIPEQDVETASFTLVRFANGVRYAIEVGGISAIPKPRWFVRGRNGAYIQYGLDQQEPALKEGRVGPLPLPSESAPQMRVLQDGELRDVPVEIVPGNYLEFYRNIVAAIRGEAELAVQPENVLESVRLILAAAESARTGQIVRF